MKSIALPLTLLICFVVSCGNHSTGISNKKTTTSPALQENAVTTSNAPAPDTTQWIEHFRAFRDAVYQGNKEKVKSFFDFPVMNEQNGIWYQAYAGDEKKFDSIGDSIRPFTEKDFDTYFNSLFPKRFITCLLKIKSEELLKTGKAETKEMKIGNTTYVLYATFDKAENTLTLILHSNSPYKINDTEWEAAEYSEMYEFAVSKNGTIKFVRAMQAG